MAEKGKGTSKLPFGMSPITLVALIVGLIAVAVVYLPGLFGGGGGTAPAPPPPRRDTAVVSAPAAPETGEQEGEKKEEKGKGKASVDGELATFLVGFGRANPFASFEKPAAPARTSPAGTTTTSSQQPLLADLRQRLQGLQGEGTAGEGGEETAGIPTPSPGPGQEAEKNETQRFILTGIVRYESLALAVIADGPRTYYVMPGEPLGKTGYVLRAIREESATIAAGEDEQILALRRKNP